MSRKVRLGLFALRWDIANLKAAYQNVGTGGVLVFVGVVAAAVVVVDVVRTFGPVRPTPE